MIFIQAILSCFINLMCNIKNFSQFHFSYHNTYITTIRTALWLVTHQNQMLNVIIKWFINHYPLTAQPTLPINNKNHFLIIGTAVTLIILHNSLHSAPVPLSLSPHKQSLHQHQAPCRTHKIDDTPYIQNSTKHPKKQNRLNQTPFSSNIFVTENPSSSISQPFIHILFFHISTNIYYGI